MAESFSSDAISTILKTPIPDSSSELPEIVVQVRDLQQKGNRFMFTATDGKKGLRAVLQSSFTPDVFSGNIQNRCLIRILNYSVNDIPNSSEKYMIVTECESVSPPLEMAIKEKSERKGNAIPLNSKQKTEDTCEVKTQGPDIVLKPKQEPVTKSAAQIVHEQRGNAAPAARLAMTRRIHPLVSLNPYQGNWMIKVRVTSKGNMRTYKNARGEGHVFNVELTDQDGTQIQATMFNEAAKKFFDRFHLGKVYYISKGTLKLANKQFRTLQNDYEMTINEASMVEEASNEETFIPETKFSFTPIDQLGPYVNGKELVDIIGVVQNVSPTMSIRRKISNESIPKRDIVVADETKRTVVVSLWNDLATIVGQELLEITDTAPVVAIKSLRVGDFQGVSLSTLSKTTVLINPDIPESNKLRSWYDSEGREATMASIASGAGAVSKSGMRSMYSDRVSLSHITRNPSMGDEKPLFFSINAYVSFIKPDQTMWYRACKTCSKKVTEAIGSGYWCEGCQKNEEGCSLRYILVVKVSDASGEAWISVFNDQAEELIGCSADELDRMKSQEGEENGFEMKLKEAKWVPHLFRVSVAPREYMNEKRQRITVRGVAPVDFAAESRFLLGEIARMETSP